MEAVIVPPDFFIAISLLSNFVKRKLPFPRGLKSRTHIRYCMVNHTVMIMCANLAEWSRQIRRYNNSPPRTWWSIWSLLHSINTGVKKRPDSPFWIPWVNLTHCQSHLWILVFDDDHLIILVHLQFWVIHGVQQPDYNDHAPHPHHSQFSPLDTCLRWWPPYHPCTPTVLGHSWSPTARLQWPCPPPPPLSILTFGYLSLMMTTLSSLYTCSSGSFMESNKPRLQWPFFTGGWCEVLSASSADLFWLDMVQVYFL